MPPDEPVVPVVPVVPAQPSAPAPAPRPAPPVLPTVRLDDVRAEERKRLLEELGVPDVDAAKAALEAQKKHEAATLSEHEKLTKAFEASLKGRDAAEKKADSYKAKYEALVESNRIRDVYVTAGVKDADLPVAQAAVAAEMAKDAKLDEAKALENVRLQYPFFFRTDAPGTPAQSTSPFYIAPVQPTTALPQQPKATGIDLLAMHNAGKFDAIREWKLKAANGR